MKNTIAPRWLVITTALMLALAVVAWLVFAYFWWDNYKYEHSTPYQHESPEWAGYRYAISNKLTSVGQCSDDPETANDVRFVAGCRGWFGQ